MKLIMFDFYNKLVELSAGNPKEAKENYWSSLASCSTGLKLNRLLKQLLQHDIQFKIISGYNKETGFSNITLEITNDDEVKQYYISDDKDFAFSFDKVEDNTYEVQPVA